MRIVKRIPVLLIVLSFVFLLSSCRMQAEYKFMREPSSIERIEIVRLEETSKYDVFSEKTLATVEDADSFLKGFKSLKCRLYYTAPKGVHSGETVIKFVYTNDEYEFVGMYGSAYNTTVGGFVNYRGYYYFEKEEFTSFIERYINVEKH